MPTRRRNHARARRRRLADFQRRKLGDTPASLRLDYLPVHPLADENALLAHLKLRPELCTKVDVYWQVNGDVVFLQTFAKSHYERHPGIYARRDADDGRLELLVVFDDDLPITTAKLHSLMDTLVHIRVGGAHLVNARLPPQLKRLQ